MILGYLVANLINISAIVYVIILNIYLEIKDINYKQLSGLIDTIAQRDSKRMRDALHDFTIFTHFRELSWAKFIAKLSDL